MLGRDHPTTLVAAIYLAFALVGLGEMESARALGQDILERADRWFGPDQPVTRLAAAVLNAVTQLTSQGQEKTRMAATALTAVFEALRTP